MVKQKSHTHYNHNINEYQMRTSYAASTRSSQQNPSKYNHVQVAHSTGCCSSSKQSQNNPSRPAILQQSQTHRPTAHERSHSKFDSPDPFYYHQGRIKKNVNRTKKPYQSPYGRNQVHSLGQTTDRRQTTKTYPTVQPTRKKKDSCCTIL